MAEVTPSIRTFGPGVKIVTWEGMAGGDTGAPVRLDGFTTRSVQATGDATNVILHGSNDGNNFAVFPTTIDLAATADEFADIPVITRFVSVGTVTGGSDTTATLVAMANR